MRAVLSRRFRSRSLRPYETHRCRDQRTLPILYMYRQRSGRTVQSGRYRNTVPSWRALRSMKKSRRSPRRLAPTKILYSVIWSTCIPAITARLAIIDKKNLDYPGDDERRNGLSTARLTCTIRHSPDDIQMRRNRTTDPPPRELNPHGHGRDGRAWNAEGGVGWVGCRRVSEMRGCRRVTAVSPS